MSPNGLRLSGARKGVRCSRVLGRHTLDSLSCSGCYASKEGNGHWHSDKHQVRQTHSAKREKGPVPRGATDERRVYQEVTALDNDVIDQKWHGASKGCQTKTSGAESDDAPACPRCDHSSAH